MALFSHRLNIPETLLPLLNEADEEIWTECSSDCLANWMQNSEEFFVKQRTKMITAALEPFLFGVTAFLPGAWINLLVHGSVLDAERLALLSPLSEDEHYMLGLAEQMFERCAQLVNNKHDVKTILNFIHDVEERPKSLEGTVDIGYAEKELNTLQIFQSLWAPIRRIYDKKKSHAKICTIYFFKIIQTQIVTYGREGIDRIDFCKKRCQIMKEENGPEGSYDYNLAGGTAYRNGRVQEAMEYYNKALQIDPFHYSCFGNRAQMYLIQKEYWSALWDCKRALIRDPTNSKTYYRNALACMELGWLEEALDMNQKALNHCKIDKQHVEITRQRRTIEGLVKKRRESESESNSNGGNNKAKTQPVYNCKDTINLLSLLVDGCGLYGDGKYKACVEAWTKALSLVGDLGLKRLEISEEEVMMMKFFHGLAMVKSGAFHNIMTAVDKFGAIQTQSPLFLAVFYGLSLAYFKLNRFDKALEYAKRGLKALVKHGAKWNPSWSSVSSNEIMKEISKDELKAKLNHLMEESSYPPKPDSVCRYHQDSQNPRLEIYRTDPDYKGFVRVQCGQECSVEFHMSCWKAYRATFPDRSNDKSMIDSPCPTPDCKGFVHLIHIFKSDSDKPAEIVSTLKQQPETPPSKPAMKMKMSNPEKIKKRKDKKLVRKERRAEDQKKKDEKQRMDKTNEEICQSTKTAVKEKEPKVYKGEATVLVKDESEEVLAQMKSKQSKPKKKKEKTSKQVLDVEVQFKDDGKLLYGADSVDFDGPAGILPVPGTAPLPLGNGMLTVPSSIPYPPDEMANVLFELFDGIFRTNGPQFLGSPVLQDMMKDFPEEATKKIISYGGLYNFLYSNKNFDIIAGRIVCVREDIPRAHAMAEQFFRENEAPGWYQQQQYNIQQQQHQSDGMPLPGSPNSGSGAMAVQPVQAPPPPPKPTFSWDKRAKELAAKNSTAGFGQNGGRLSSVIAPDELPPLLPASNAPMEKPRGRNADLVEDSNNNDGFIKVSRKKSNSASSNNNDTVRKETNVSSGYDMPIHATLTDAPCSDVTSVKVRSSSRPPGNVNLDDFLSTMLSEKSTGSSGLTSEKILKEKSQGSRSPDWDLLGSLTNSLPDLSAKGSDDAVSVMDSVDDDDDDDVNDNVIDEDISVKARLQQVTSSLSTGKQESVTNQANVLSEEPTPQLLSNLGNLLNNNQRRDSESSSHLSEDANLALRSGSPALSQGSSGSSQSQPPPLKPLKMMGGMNILPRMKKGKRLGNQSTPSSSLSQSSLESNGSLEMKKKEQRNNSGHPSVSSSLDHVSGRSRILKSNSQIFEDWDGTGGEGPTLSEKDALQLNNGAGIDPLVLEIFSQFNDKGGGEVGVVSKSKLMELSGSNFGLIGSLESQGGGGRVVDGLGGLEGGVGGRGGFGGVGTGRGGGGGGRLGGKNLLENMGNAIQKLKMPEMERSCVSDRGTSSSSGFLGDEDAIKKLWSNDGKTIGPGERTKDFKEEMLSMPESHSPFSSSLSSTTGSSSTIFPSHHTHSSSVPSSLFGEFLPSKSENLSDGKHQDESLSSSHLSSSSSSYLTASSALENSSSSSPISSLQNPQLSYSPFGVGSMFNSLRMNEASKTSFSAANETSISSAENFSLPNSAVQPQSGIINHPSKRPGLLPDPTFPQPNRLLGQNLSPSPTALPAAFKPGLLETPVMPGYNPALFAANAQQNELFGMSNLPNKGIFNPLAAPFCPSSSVNRLPHFNAPTTKALFENPEALARAMDRNKTGLSFDQKENTSSLNPKSREFLPMSSSVPSSDGACQTEFVKTTSVKTNTPLTGEKLTQLAERLKEVMQRNQALEEELDEERLEKTNVEETRDALNRKLQETKTALEMEWNKSKDLEEQLNELRTEVLSLQGFNAELRKQATKAFTNADSLEQERNRAVTAEKKILQISAQLMGKKLESKKAEAGKHIEQLQSACVSFSSHGMPVPSAISIKQKEWQDFVSQCDVELDKLQHYFDQQIGQLNKGRLLLDLPEVSAKITVPEMPKPPAGVEAVLAKDKSPEKDGGGEKGAGGLTSEGTDDGLLARGGASHGPNINGGASPPKQAPSFNATSPPNRLGLQGGNPNMNSLNAPPGLKPLSIPTPLQPRMPFGPSHTLLQRLSQPNQLQQQQQQQLQQQQQQQKQQQQQTTFDRIVEEMQKTFPIFTREVISTLLEVLRRNNGGSLTHLSIPQVLGGLRELVFGIMGQKSEGMMGGDGQKVDSRVITGLMRQQSEEVQPPSPPPSKFKMEDLPVISRIEDEDYENFCPICHEDMEPGTSTVLDCKHIFHKECIRKWFQQQRSCPNCRVYSLLKDDFPSLK